MGTRGWKTRIIHELERLRNQSPWSWFGNPNFGFEFLLRLIFNIFENLDQNITRSRMIKYQKHQLEGLGEISNFLHKFIDTLCDKTRALSLTEGPVLVYGKLIRHLWSLYHTAFEMIYTVFGLLEEIYHTPHNDYKVFNRYCLTGCLFYYSDYFLSIYKQSVLETFVKKREKGCGKLW